MTKLTHICRSCGTQQRQPYTEPPSSFGAELLVWVVAIALAIALHWIFLLGAFAFSLWRYGAARPGHCSRCSGQEVIPIDSPIGRQLAEGKRDPM